MNRWGLLYAYNSDTSYSRYFNQYDRRPDIRITIFKNDDEIFSEKAGLIIECKCRHKRYLINTEHNPDVMNQLDDFTKLDYYNSFKKKRIHPIKEVVVLYPKQDGEPVITHKVFSQITFLMVEPTSFEGESTSPFGYDALKTRLVEFLAQAEESEAIYI